MATKIIIHRENAFLNKARSVKIFIDDVEMKSPIKSGGSEEYLVEPGTHTVTAKINWYSSRDFTVHLNEGESKFVKLHMGMKYFGAAYIILLIAILADFVPKLINVPKPTWLPWAKVAVVIPFLMYMLYYMLIAKKDYLVLKEDNDNMFN